MPEMADPEIDVAQSNQLFEKLYSSKDKIAYGLSLFFYAVLEGLFQLFALPEALPSGFIALVLGIVCGELLGVFLTRAKERALKTALFDENVAFIKKKYQAVSELLDQERARVLEQHDGTGPPNPEYLASLEVQKKELFAGMLAEIKAIPVPHLEDGNMS
jgi:hypothetical protein